MRRLNAAMLVTVLLSLSAWGAEAPTAEPAKAWIAQSNTYTNRLLAVELEHHPERGSREGLAKFDEQISNPTLADEIAERHELEAALAGVNRDGARETDKRVQRGPRDPAQGVRPAVSPAGLRLRARSAVSTTPVTSSSRACGGLLDDQVAAERRPAAVARLRKYAGVERGLQPFTEILKQRELEQIAKPGVTYPVEGAARDGARAQFQVTSTASRRCSRKYQLSGWEPAYAQTEDASSPHYDAWVRETILPKARTDFRLPPEKYALAFEQYGIDIPPAQIAAMAHAAFTRVPERDGTARRAGRQGQRLPLERLPRGDRELKKTADHRARRSCRSSTIACTRSRQIIVAQNLVTLPSRPAIIRLATAAETAQQPAPHMSPPPFLHNTGQRGEFVLPLNIPSANGGEADKYDDFTFDAVAWTLTAHEARPGHELQFDSMVEQGVSLARALYAFNSTNAEGWGLYSEYIMQPYEPAGRAAADAAAAPAARRARVPRPGAAERRGDARRAPTRCWRRTWCSATPLPRRRSSASRTARPDRRTATSTDTRGCSPLRKETEAALGTQIRPEEVPRLHPQLRACCRPI